MRITSIAYLFVSAIALSACAATESAYQLDAGLGTCGLNCGIKPDPVIPPVVVDDPDDPNDTVNIGNETTIKDNDLTADKAIVLSKSVLQSPALTGGRARLTQDKVAKTAKIAIDMKSPRNAALPVPKTMEEYEYGSLNDSFQTVVGINLVPGTIPKNLGAVEYHEYRTSEAADGADIDEELQVWEWQYSRASQYRDKTGGGEARNQAWSFTAAPGDAKTTAAAMTTRGSATYNGRYTSTAKTWNNVDVPLGGQTLSKNGLWQVTGRTQANANFVTGAFDATLTPEVWIGWQSLNGATGRKEVIVNNNCTNNNLCPNQAYFMNDNILLKGVISNDLVTGNQIIGTAKQGTDLLGANYVGPNGVTNYATPSEWLTSANPMYGSFYGPTAEEVTGIFSLKAESPEPFGGSLGINDDRSAFIQQSGVFHAQ